MSADYDDGEWRAYVHGGSQGTKWLHVTKKMECFGSESWYPLGAIIDRSMVEKLTAILDELGL